ncbi:hypothetical protein ARAF_1449 [Arsenophonus endosymbiont of Aleurodicus floccissimus]|nr:hypothetical protein ARAF_1449 [Arsenophonus endosymbiont of Aleurodicus floccissimus]
MALLILMPCSLILNFSYILLKILNYPLETADKILIVNDLLVDFKLISLL